MNLSLGETVTEARQRARFKLRVPNESNTVIAGGVQARLRGNLAGVRRIIERSMNAFPPQMEAALEQGGETNRILAASEAISREGSVGIRPFRPADVPLLHAAARESIPELCDWMVWCHPAYSLDDSAAFISSCEAKWERDESFSFAIVDTRDGTFLGSTGLNQINRIHGVANLGYWVRSSRTGRGIASVAVRLAASFGLRELGFNRLEMIISTANIASQRVAEKAGARREGILRNKLVLQERLCDAVMYSLVAQDYRA